MKSYIRFHKFHNRSNSWAVISRFIFLSGISIWLGGLVFFVLGVAPVNFDVAKAWELTGTNPIHENQPVNYRTIGGALTQTSLQKLNVIEFSAIILVAFGLCLAWMPKHNRNTMLMIQTFLIALMALLYIIYTESIMGKMLDIQQTVAINFKITDPALKSAAHLEFDKLHKTYSTLTSINGVLAILQLILFSVNPIATANKDVNK